MEAAATSNPGMPLITRFVGYGPIMAPQLRSYPNPSRSWVTRTNEYKTESQLYFNATEFNDFVSDRSESERNSVDKTSEVGYGVIFGPVPINKMNVICIMPLPLENHSVTVIGKDKDDNEVTSREEIVNEKFLTPAIKQGFRYNIRDKHKKWCNLAKIVYDDHGVKEIYFNKDCYVLEVINRKSIKIGAIALCTWNKDVRWLTFCAKWENYGVLLAALPEEKKLKYFTKQEHEDAFNVCKKAVEGEKISLKLLKQKAMSLAFGERNADTIA